MNFKNLDNVCLALLVGSLSLGQLTRMTLPLGGAIYAHDLVLLVWGLLLLTRQPAAIPRPQASLTRLTTAVTTYPLETLFLGWIGLGWAAALITGTFQLTTLLYAGRLLFYLGSLYLVSRAVSRHQPTLFTGLTVVGLLMLLLGWCQYLLLPDTRFLAVLGWDDHYYRLIGSLLDPNFTGLVFVLTFVYLEKLPWPKVILPLQLLLAGGLALTFSRSSYLAWLVTLVGLGIVAALKKRPPAFFTHALGTVLCALVFLAALTLAPKPGGEGINLLRTASLEARMESSQATLDYQWRPLLVGEGLFQPQRAAINTNDFTRPNTARFADNFLLFIFNGTGLVGTIVFLALLAKWGRVLWRHDPLITVAVLSTLTHSFFNATLLQPFVMILVWGGILRTGNSR